MVPRTEGGRKIDDDADDPRASPANVRIDTRQRQFVGSSLAPLHEVGALLDAKDVHGGRSAYNHLLSLAQSDGIPKERV